MALTFLSQMMALYKRLCKMAAEKLHEIHPTLSVVDALKKERSTSFCPAATDAGLVAAGGVGSEPWSLP